MATLTALGKDWPWDQKHRCRSMLNNEILSDVKFVVKRECPLKPSHIENIWHMMENQNFSYSSQRYPRVSLETWCDFFLDIFF